MPLEMTNPYGSCWAHHGAQVLKTIYSTSGYLSSTPFIFLGIVSSFPRSSDALALGLIAKRRLLITEHRLQNSDVILPAGTAGIRHVVQTVFRADDAEVASDQTVEVAEEYLSADWDAVETSKLLIGYIDGPIASGPHWNVNPS